MMNIPKQHPFSLYDFIGYFIPGALLLFLLILLDTGKDSFCDICDFIKQLSISCNQSFLHAFSTFIFFFVISYILGHIISILSNFIIEKSRICKYHNHLSYVLLGINNIDNIKKEGSYFYNFLLFYVFVYEYIFTVIQKWCPGKGKWQEYIYEEFRHLKSIEYTERKIAQEAILNILNKTFGSNLPEDYFTNINKNIPDNFFGIIYHYVIENESHHLFKIQNYVALYGFMRNISMVFCILFWLTMIFLILNLIGMVNLTWPKLNYFLLFIYSFCGFLSMIGLHKYKKRYTMEILMAASVIYRIKSNPS